MSGDIPAAVLRGAAQRERNAAVEAVDSAVACGDWLSMHRGFESHVAALDLMRSLAGDASNYELELDIGRYILDVYSYAREAQEHPERSMQ